MKFGTVARVVVVLLLVIVAVGALWMRGKGKNDAMVSELTFEAVGRRTLVVSIEATGTVEPINLVEVKSKASGQIIRMPVEVGSRVRPGDLLVQIDTLDVGNAYRQAAAALVAARVQAEVAEAQRARAEQLYAALTITAPEHESALLTYANAQSSLVRATTELANARLRMEDATVRAPIAGTVLEKPVSVGQMIASATSSVSGGTTILKMADLRLIRVRALVPESDIGGVKEGLPATISVDAYPNRRFDGRVEKVEPQAVVQQSVTMFPVLLSIDNEEGLLLPGMNGEVVVTTARAMDALAVPVDAVRGMRDLSTIALILGADPDSLRAGLRRPREGGAGAANAAASADTTGAGERMARRAARRGGGGGGERRGAGGGVGAPGGSGGPGAGAGSGPGGAGGGGRNAMFAVVKGPGGYEARGARLGVSNFDFAEVLSGLTEGDSVALLGAAEMQAQRSGFADRIRDRMGAGFTSPSGSSSRSGASRGSGGGGR
jgi:HlyD family secretion protein